jgi:hypothetical protein
VRPIPKKLRKEISLDLYYSTCCIDDRMCEGPIQLHHAVIQSGRQLNEKWAIVPACIVHHNHRNKEYLERLELEALNRATDEQLLEISKATDFIHRRGYLRDRYGTDG